MHMQALKEMLKLRGMIVSGTKDKLIDRLLEGASDAGVCFVRRLCTRKTGMCTKTDKA